METKSIDQMLSDLCNRLRAENDAGILSRLRRLCEDEYARSATLNLLNLKPGDNYYDISADRTFKVTE